MCVFLRSSVGCSFVCIACLPFVCVLVCLLVCLFFLFAEPLNTPFGRWLGHSFGRVCVDLSVSCLLD